MWKLNLFLFIILTEKEGKSQPSVQSLKLFNFCYIPLPFSPLRIDLVVEAPSPGLFEGWGWWGWEERIRHNAPRFRKTPNSLPSFLPCLPIFSFLALSLFIVIHKESIFYSFCQRFHADCGKTTSKRRLRYKWGESCSTCHSLPVDLSFFTGASPPAPFIARLALQQSSPFSFLLSSSMVCLILIQETCLMIAT